MVEARRELAERANRAKSDFLADVAHEIRTPISGMSGMSDLLAHTALDERQARYVTRIRGAIDMLLKLINNLLDLARIESGHLELSPVPVDLCALLQEMVELESPTAQAKGIRLHLECDDSIPECVSVDPLRLRQILLNLIGNALKFIERGEVRLTASSTAAGWIRLCVIDTGPGLSAEAISRLFKRFSQADEAVSQRHGGSGLGLAIVSQLVELMQGRLTVESEPGRGSTFAVELPMPRARFDAPPKIAQTTERKFGLDEVTSPIRSSTDLDATAPADAAMRVLLVEDDAIVSEALGDLLERDGCTCVRAVHGLAALAELERHAFDVALIDFDLPGLSGLELARMLRARGSRLPLIGISARADDRAEADALAAGMDLFLRKPIAARLLRESLAAFVRSPMV